jgi:hypothetical protein
MAKEVGICTRGQGFKKVPRYQGTSVHNAILLQTFPCSTNDMVKFKQDALMSRAQITSSSKSAINVSVLVERRAISFDCSEGRPPGSSK